MRDEDGAALEVGFAIDTGGSFESLARLGEMMASTEAKVLAEANRIESATAGMVNLAPATAAINSFGNAATGGLGQAAAAMTSFGNAATREGAKLAASKASAEKAAEGLILRLDREANALGKTKDQMRDARIEAVALTAAELGLTEVADRLLASARNRQAVADALGEDRAAAEMAAAAAATRERAAAETALYGQMLERSRVQAALDRTNGADRPRATDAGATFSALEARAIEEAAADAARDHARAQEAVNAQLIERARLQQALDRTNGADRLRATELGATYSALAEREAQAAEAATKAAQADADAEAAAVRLRSALDPLWAAQKRYDEQLVSHADLLARGKISQQEHSAAVAMSARELDVARQSLDQYGEAVGFNRTQMMMFRSAAFNASSSIAAGMPLYRVLIEQGLEVAQAFSMGDGGAAGALNKAGSAARDGAADIAAGAQASGGALDGLKDKAKEAADSLVEEHGVRGALSKVSGILTPTRLAIGATAAAVAIGTKAWLDYSGAVSELQRLSMGSGHLLGLDGAALEQSAVAAARAGDMAVSAAREIEQVYVSSGNVTKDVLVALTAATRDFAAATGQDTVDAAKELDAALADPIAGAEELAERYGWISVATAEYIGKLVEQNEQEKAQKILTDAVADATAGAADQANALARGWNNVKVAVSGAWEMLGKALDRMATGGALQDRIAALQADRARGPNLGQILTGTTETEFRAGIDRQIADLRYQMRQEAARAGRDKLNSDQTKAQALVDSYTGTDRRGSLQTTIGTLRAGLATDMSPDQRRDMTEALNAYRHAETTLIPVQQKANELAAISARIAAAKTPAEKAALAAQKVRIEQQGQVITSENVERLATEASNRVLGQASTKRDRHAEALVRDAQAAEAQIRNLYALSSAYGQSGAAALIAEARAKAESGAIKKRGDIEAAVEREVRLAIAQRVSGAAKSTAALSQQAVAQEEMNAAVTAGLVPAARANEMLRDRLEDAPLLAAIEAAKLVRDVQGAHAATAALETQRAARDRLTDAERKAQLLSALGGNADRLEELREELRLIGETDEARARALATLRATQEAEARGWAGPDAARHIREQGDLAAMAVTNAQAQDAYNASLTQTADRWDIIAGKVQSAAQGMADAFGEVGRSIGDLASIYASFHADRARAEAEHKAAILKAGSNEKLIAQENARFALRSSGAQIAAFGDMTAAAKGFFREGSAGYEALGAAEKAFRAVQFALSVRAMAQDVIETGAKLANNALKIASGATEAVVNAIKSLPFPLNLAAGAATVAALASIGVSIAGAFGGGGRNALPASNTGTGTVLGDGKAQSESLRRSIDQLREVDTLTNSYARQMAGSLRSIDSQIGGLAAVLVRSGDINADAGVKEGFKTDLTGKLLSGAIDPLGIMSKIPVIGGLFGAVKSVINSLFGSSTKVIGSGLYGDAQTVGQILASGFDAGVYSEIEKKKKFLGITTGKSYDTKYGDIDPALENQFTLILRSFNDAIAAAAGPLGQSTGEIQARLNSFVVNIGKIDLKDLSGEEIQAKLEAVFGAAADNMANAAFPGIASFQQVGEGAFETLVRVASTAEAVTNALDQMGSAARAMSIDAKLGLAAQFDSVGDLTSAIGGYFEAFYTPAEQAAAKSAQLARVFGNLGLAMPATLAAYRALVDAQDLNTKAGQAAYATLIQLAPAFAELQQSMAGAKSAVDVAAERADLERRLLELRGDTAALRALELAKLDASNRDLQQQIYAIEDAQKAAAAADELRQAWTSVGDGIMDEVERIRGLTGAEAGGFAAALGRFNAATSAARGGDLDAAKALPQLSQAVLAAAADAASSRQELDRVRAQTAAALEATYAAIGGRTTSATSAAALLAGASTAQAAATPAAANDDDALTELRALRAEVAGLRADNNAGHAATAGNTGRVARTLDNVTAAAGGDAITTVVEAAA